MFLASALGSTAHIEEKMKITISILALAAISSPALAADRTWYLGGDIGRTEFTTVPDNTHRNGVGVTLGAKVTENLAFELQLRHLGSWTTTTIVLGTQDGNVQFSTDHSFTALGASVLGIMPLSEDFSLYGRLGYARHTMRVSGQSPAARSISAHANQAFWGLGASYRVDKRLSLHLEFLKLGSPVFNLYNDYWVGGNIQQFNVGLKYAF
ncbi:MAG: hypothetical protein C0423_17165 [Methylibium sp.]|nr:hypothetical protein [Methylibium sp.]